MKIFQSFYTDDGFFWVECFFSFDFEKNDKKYQWVKLDEKDGGIKKFQIL